MCAGKLLTKITETDILHTVHIVFVGLQWLCANVTYSIMYFGGRIILEENSSV